MKVAPVTAQAPAKTTSEVLAQRKCACSVLTGDCEECKEKKLMQRKAVADRRGSISAPSVVSEVVRSPGLPLSDETRTYFETRLGHDFSRVRVHTGPRAADSARAVYANAYTVGPNIVFAPGQYSPTTAHGRQLLAHELTHVVQQRSLPAADIQPNAGLSLSDPSDASEQEAEQIAREVVSEQQPVRVASQPLQAVGHTCVQRDLALKPPEPGATVTLTPAQIEEAVKFNQVELKDQDKLKLICDIVGVPASNNERLAQAVALLQAQFKLPVSGKVDQQTWDLVNKERQQEKKDLAKWNHEEQQKQIIKLLEGIRKIPHDTSKGTSDPDTLLLNSVEWIDNKIIELIVMTPTHDYKTRRGGQFAYFDSRVKHPDIGGDYETTPPAAGAADPGVQYKTDEAVAAAALFKEITFYTSTSPITDEDFRRNLVHEVQHVADQVGGRAALTMGMKSDLARTIDSYQTEFRSYWVQPALPVGARPFLRAYENFGSSQTAAKNYGPINANPSDKCKNLCVSPAGSTDSSQCKKTCDVVSSGQTTNFRNEKQESIFYYLLEHYKNDRFDCFYICVPEFRQMAHDFSQPTGENLINSVRIEALIRALNECNSSMSITDGKVQAVMDAAKKLDPVDRTFLKEIKKATPPGAKQPPAKDIKSSQPFWDRAGNHLPKAALTLLEQAV